MQRLWLSPKEISERIARTGRTGVGCDQVLSVGNGKYAVVTYRIEREDLGQVITHYTAHELGDYHTHLSTCTIPGLKGCWGAMNSTLMPQGYNDTVVGVSSLEAIEEAWNLWCEDLMGRCYEVIWMAFPELQQRACRYQSGVITVYDEYNPVPPKIVPGILGYPKTDPRYNATVKKKGGKKR